MKSARVEKLVMSPGNQPTVERHRDEAIRVRTPLDAIMILERAQRDHRIGTVVLAGGYAHDQVLARFLHTFYPAVRIESEA
jgi:hypothetical protein